MKCHLIKIRCVVLGSWCAEQVPVFLLVLWLVAFLSMIRICVTLVYIDMCNILFMCSCFYFISIYCVFFISYWM
jgi:hypothetical protein